MQLTELEKLAPQAKGFRERPDHIEIFDEIDF